MRSGDRVIYFKQYAFEPAPARIGTYRFEWASGDITVEPEGGGLVQVHRSYVHPYGDALWVAWVEYQKRMAALEAVYDKIKRGKAPAELLAPLLF